MKKIFSFVLAALILLAAMPVAISANEANLVFESVLNEGADNEEVISVYRTDTKKFVFLSYYCSTTLEFVITDACGLVDRRTYDHSELKLVSLKGIFNKEAAIADKNAILSEEELFTDLGLVAIYDLIECIRIAESKENNFADSVVDNAWDAVSEITGGTTDGGVDGVLGTIVKFIENLLEEFGIYIPLSDILEDISTLTDTSEKTLDDEYTDGQPPSLEETVKYYATPTTRAYLKNFLGMLFGISTEANGDTIRWAAGIAADGRPVSELRQEFHTRVKDLPV